MRNRKWWCFVVAIAAIVFLTFFGKEGANGAIVTLALGLFASNVVQKNEHFNGDKE